MKVVELLELSVSELEELLREAKKREAEKLAEKKKNTPVIWKFTLTRSEKHYEKIFDDTCVMYYLSGEVVNKEEAESVGHHVTMQGGGNYLFNKGTNKVVMAVGGGTYYLGFSYVDSDFEVAQKAMNELSEFIVMNPEGGDVTYIINAYRESRK